MSLTKKVVRRFFCAILALSLCAMAACTGAEPAPVAAEPSEASAESGVATEQLVPVKLDTTDTDAGFACVVSADGNIYWQIGKDSCNDLMKLYSLNDDENYIGIHVVPDNSEVYPYLYPEGSWTMLAYNSESPSWFTAEMETGVWSAFEEWKDTVYSIFDYKGLRELTADNTVQTAPAADYEVTEEDIGAFLKFAHDINSLVTYVRESVLNTVQSAVGPTICSDAYNYVQEIRKGTDIQSTISDLVVPFNVSNVGVVQSNFFAAICGSFFDVDEWTYYTEEAEGYPYEPVMYMWEHGLILSQDSDLIWRLHSFKDAEILYTINDDAVSSKNAFAAIVDEGGTVYWQVGMDNVDSIKTHFGLSGNEYAEVQVKPVLNKENASLVLRDGYNPDATIIFPYLDEKSVWTISVVNENIPAWFDSKHEEAIMTACAAWKESVYTGFNFDDAGSAFTEETREVAAHNDEDIALLAEWAIAWHNITDKGVSPTAAITLSGYEQVSRNLWDDFDSYLLSCWREVHTECPGSVVSDGYFAYKGDEAASDASAKTFVADSVSDVMEAVSGYYFTNVETWEYYDGDITGYPYAAGAELVLKNLVPCTDGENWYLCSGEDATIVFEIDEASLLSNL